MRPRGVSFLRSPHSVRIRVRPRNRGAGRGVVRGVAFVTQPLFDRSAALRAGKSVAGAADPDLDLVDRWREGDAKAFEALVIRHQRRVFGLLFRMLGNREEAEDAAQETFLNLHRHGHRFRRESRFSTFVYRVAVNAALNRRRSLGRRRAHLERLADRTETGESVPTSPRDPEAQASGDQIRQRVQAEIACLAPALRVPLVLFDIEGMPYSEIAGVLDIAEGTVKSRIHRARLALRERLSDLAVETGEAT